MLIHAHILSARLLPVAVATYTWSMTDPNRAKLMAVLEMVLIFDTNLCSIWISCRNPFLVYQVSCCVRLSSSIRSRDQAVTHVTFLLKLMVI